MNLLKEISKLHSSKKLFSTVEKYEKGNILLTLKKFDEFDYLSKIYKEYLNHFNEEKDSNSVTKFSRGRDLPFFGKCFLNNKPVKYIFYFEGSLLEDKLSITVLFHLWCIKEKAIIDQFLGKNKWMLKSSFNFMVDNLNITSEVLENCYVTDAIRFIDDLENRKLIEQEIILLNPKLVICVGTKARDLVGMKYYEQNTKFHFIPFPSFQFKSRVERYKDSYEELNSVLNSLK